MGRLLYHPARWDWERKVRKYRTLMCHCGHRVHEHLDVQLCGKCDCILLHVIGKEKPIGVVQPSMWVNGKWVRPNKEDQGDRS